MRKWFPWCALGLVAGLALGRPAVAESSDHTSPDDTSTPSTVSSQPGTLVLTRQEALIQGLRQIQIPSEGMRDLVKATEKTSNLTPQKFGEIIDKIQGEGNFSKEQGDQLKQLFRTELGEVKNSPVGPEINAAAKRLLEASETTRVTSPEATAKAVPADKGQPDGTLAGNVALASALPPALEGRLAQLESQLGAGKGQSLSKEELAATQTALTQQLLSKLDRGGDRGRGRGANDALGGGLLDALRAQLLTDKNGEGRGGGDFGDLKNALSQNQQQHQQPSPRKNDSKDDSKKIEPPPRPEREKDRDNSVGNLAALLRQNSGNGNNNNNDKNQKGEEKFELPPSKFKDERDKKPSVSKNDTSKNPIGDQQQAVDPSAAAELAKNLAALGPKSPLQGIGGGNGFGGGFGGDGGGFGGLGGGTMGPNIIGSASAPPGGNFGGDPFSGLGGGEGGGGVAGFSFAKTVAYGGGGGEGGGGGGGDGEGGTVDGGSVYGAESSRNSAPARGPMVLALTPIEDSTKRSLMDYFGKLKSTLCGENSGDVEVCKKIRGRKYIEALQKRASR